MAKASYEGLEKLRQCDRSFVLTRSGYAGVQHWSPLRTLGYVYRPIRTLSIWTSHRKHLLRIYQSALPITTLLLHAVSGSRNNGSADFTSAFVPFPERSKN